MSRNTITIIISIILLVVAVVSCISDDRSDTKTIDYEITGESANGYVFEEVNYEVYDMEAIPVGKYHLYRTVDVQEYLGFLENFDATKYEIVNISTSMDVSAKGSDEFYMVTYREIN